MPRPALVLGTLSLDAAAGPKQRQLYAALRDAVLTGRLAPGARLPSTRALAAELGVGRNTVVAAFEQLVAEGYVTARIGDGTRVARLAPEAHLEARRPAVRPAVRRVGPPPTLSSRGRALVATPRPGPWVEPRAFQTGRPALEQFPHAVWGRLVARRARRPPVSALGYSHAAGQPVLREAIAAYLGGARGVPCTPAQVIVVAGAQAGLDLACRLLADAGDRAWLEDPGYTGARGAFSAAGLRAVPVPVDDDGLDVAAGIRLAPDARLVHVTPSHQFPLGVTMPLARRLALVEWAERAGAWVVEDDYDSEFRYAGRPLAAMAGLAPGGRVVHLGSFSKTMFAALRAGWLVVPEALAGGFEVALRHTGHTVPAVVQAALADFLVEGHFAAHLRRMRVLYAARQARLLRALARRLGGVAQAVPADTGMQLPVWLPDGSDDLAVSRAAFAARVVAQPLSALFVGRTRRPGLFLGYGGVPERDIDDGVARLAGVVRAHLPARSVARAQGRC